MTEKRIEISDKSWMNDPNQNPLLSAFGTYEQLPWWKRLLLARLRVSLDMPQYQFVPKKQIPGYKHSHVWLEDINDDA